MLILTDYQVLKGLIRLISYTLEEVQLLLEVLDFVNRVHNLLVLLLFSFFDGN